MSEYTELVERAELAASSAISSAAQTKSDKDTVVSLYNEIKAIIDAGGGGSCKFYECTAVDNGKDIPAIPAVPAGIVVTGFSDSYHQAMNGHYSLVGEFTTMKTSVWKHDTADYYIGYSEEYSYWCLSYGQSFYPWDAYKYVSSDGTKAPWEYDWSTADGNSYGETIKLTGSFEDKPEVPMIPGTGVKSWSGYEWLWDDEVGYTKASDITTRLSWTINMPEVGNTYTEDGLVRIQLMYNTETATPLTLTAEQANSTVKLAKIGTVDASGIQYRYSDDDAWQDYSIGTNITLVNVGDTVQFKNSKNQLSKDGDNHISVQATGKIAASGNIQSMLNYEDVCGDGAFAKFFENCTALTQAPNLLAKSGGAHCYSQMFNGCSSLKDMPVISATKFTGTYSCQRMFGDCTSLTKVTPINAIEVGQYCYRYMFSGCSALETPPALNTTKFDKYSCQYMFENCSSLKETPHFVEAVLAEYCYQYMFRNCSSLTTAHKLPSLVLSDYCYQSMFYDCTALTTAPELPATTLANYCYSYMFYGCTSLTQAPSLPATIMKPRCYQSMFDGCSALTTAPELPATTLATRCYESMFSECSNLLEAPKLTATTLADYCYSYMFYQCSNLEKAPMIAAETFGSSSFSRMFYDCYKLNEVRVTFTTWGDYMDSWLSNVSSTGTFYKPDELPEEFGSSRIPEGWTVKSINE